MCLIIVGKNLTCIYLPHWKSWLQLELLTAKYFWEHFVFSCMIKCRDWTPKGNTDFYQRLTRGRARFKHGGMLALLKYPFYPLFNFDNDMNLISKSLTILISARLLVVSHLHIYFGGTSFLQVFYQFWSMKWRGPWSSANTEKDEGQSPKREDQSPCWFEAHSCTSILQESPKDQAHEDEIKILRD